MGWNGARFNGAEGGAPNLPPITDADRDGIPNRTLLEFMRANATPNPDVMAVDTAETPVIESNHLDIIQESTDTQ